MEDVDSTIYGNLDLRMSINKNSNVIREEIDRRKQNLQELGFTEGWIQDIQESKHTLIQVENINAKIAGLTERGFENPQKMIARLPAILGYGFENIDAKIAGLTERGFENPQKMIARFPAILGSDFENIDAKIAGLTERGFENPQKMIASLPSIFSFSFENIDAKIAGLTERGFENPQKMIASLPAILGYSWENIDAKIAGLMERGFENPQKMIERFPATLGYDFENIDAKIALINRLVSHYKLKVSAPELMEQEKALISSKIDKLWVLARIVRDIGDPSILSPSSLWQLSHSNLEVVVVAQQEVAQKTFHALMKKVKEVKTRGEGREQRREQISTMSDTDAIARRYLRGYPIKK